MCSRWFAIFFPVWALGFVYSYSQGFPFFGVVLTAGHQKPASGGRGSPRAQKTHISFETATKACATSKSNLYIPTRGGPTSQVHAKRSGCAAAPMPQFPRFESRPAQFQSTVAVTPSISPAAADPAQQPPWFSGNDAGLSCQCSGFVSHP